MDNFINVTSEIGKLKRVMIHKPGKEIENLSPEYLERLLFDDIPYLKVAEEEHDIFAKILLENDVEVLYLKDLAVEVLQDIELRKNFMEEIFVESKITSETVKAKLEEYLLSKTPLEFVECIMAGIRKDEVTVSTESESLVELIDDDNLFYLDPMPNLYFTRDPAASVGNGITVNSMKMPIRQKETLFIKYIHKYHKNFTTSNVPLWYDRHLPDSIEGGDELVLSDKVIAIGCSQRTSAEGIEVFAKNLLYGNTTFEKILVFQIPPIRAFMHLDTVFTMVDYDKFTIHPGIEGPLKVFEITKGAKGKLNYKVSTGELDKILASALSIKGIELIRCGGGDPIIAGREQWNDGSNTLAIAPGVVVTYERNYVSNELLAKRGIKVLTMPSAELSRGRGGPRCMSMPLFRENL